MSFRPEEVYSASREGPVLRPLPYGDVNISAQVRIALAFDDSISYNEAQGSAAIQTWSVDANGFSRKNPADRQGFESSLRKPLLLTVYGNPVLGRQVVEGSKRRNHIGIRS